MERGVSESKRRFLSDESGVWVERGIVSPEQRDEIMGCYVVRKNLPTIVITLGAAMIGIGALCVIAANWRGIPDSLKIALIVGLYTGSVAAAYACERWEHRTAAGAMLFLSGFLLLGGLALLSQIFHIGGSVNWLLLTWLVAYAPTLLIVRDISIYILYEVVTAVYMCLEFAELMDIRRSVFGGSALPPVVFGPRLSFLLMVLLIAVAWLVWYEERRAPRLRNQSMLKNFFIGGSTRRIMLSNFLVAIWFSWFCVLNSRHESALPYIFGMLIIGTVINVMAWQLDASDLDWQALFTISACGLALSMEITWSGRIMGSSGRSFILEMCVSSVALGAYLVWRILRRGGGGAWSAFFFCCLLARWYFDVFFDFMDKGLFFLVGGAILVAIGAAFVRWNLRASRIDADGGDCDE